MTTKHQATRNRPPRRPVRWRFVGEVVALIAFFLIWWAAQSFVAGLFPQP